MQLNKLILCLKYATSDLLYQIKKRSLAKQQLLSVFDAIIISRFTYAAAAWRGFATVAECNAIQAFLNKVKRWSIISDDRSIDDILDGMDYGLFNKMQFSNHCLHHILPNERHSLPGMKMCKKVHNYNLPIKTEIARKSFLNRMLVKYQ